MPPLIAALALFGPTTALAAGPAPDAPATETSAAHGSSSGGGLAPDAAPSAVHRAAHVAAPRHVDTTPAPVVTAHSTFAAQRVTEAARKTTPPSRATPKRPRPSHVVPRTRPAAVRIVDAMPLGVDLHPNLGAVTAPLLDHSVLVLAAIALLAAVAAAGSGAALVLTARELL